MAEPSHKTLEEAAEWFAILRDGQASNEHKSDWRKWLDAKPENKTAWLYVEKSVKVSSPYSKRPTRIIQLTIYTMPINDYVNAADCSVAWPVLL